MAIALQQAPIVSTDTTSTLNPITIPNVPVAAGNGNRLIVVCVHLEGNATGTDATVSTVTKNGVGFTKLDSISPADWSRSEIWYLKDPAAGTHNIVVTLSAAGKHRLASAYVFDGVDQTTTFRTVAKSAGSAALVSNTVPSVVSGDYLLDCLTIDATGHNTQTGANQTERYDTATSGSDNVSDTQAGSDGGVMSHTWTTSAPYSHIAIALISSAAAAYQIRPDSDIDATGWSTSPLYSKINDSSDATVIQATAV
jgi:hypothetical protein